MMRSARFLGIACVVVAVILIWFDLTSKTTTASNSVAEWGTNHPFVVATVVGVLAGVLAGFMVDWRIRERERERWAFEHKQALRELAAAGSMAGSMFPDDDADALVEGRKGLTTAEKDNAVDGAQLAAETFGRPLQTWRGVLRDSDDADFLKHCEHYAETLSLIAGALKRARDYPDRRVRLTEPSALVMEEQKYFDTWDDRFIAELQEHLDHLTGRRGMTSE